jgi:hypothetical protein
MRTDQNGKSATKDAKHAAGRGSSDSNDFFWKRARFKDCCYFRINTVDESAFIGARRSAHAEGKPTF